MRLKIIAGNLVAVLLLGLASYFVVSTKIEGDLGAQLDGRLSDDATLFERSWRLTAIEFTEAVQDRALARDTREVFLAIDDAGRQTRANQQSDGIARWFADPSRRRGGAPDLVLLTDPDGKVVARNGAVNSMVGEPLGAKIPALLPVVHGEQPTAHDVWYKDDEEKALEVAIAPVRNDAGVIQGALLVGYDISNGLATREADVLDRDVAFLRDGKVYSSSLEQARSAALGEYLFSATNADSTNQVLQHEGQSGTAWRTRIEGVEYIGVAHHLPLAPSANMAFVVLANRTAAVSIASSATTTVLILTVVFALMVLVYGFVIGSSIIKPIEEIEEGVLQVINGRTDLRLEVKSPDLGGLAYRINQLLNVFTGVSEESEDESGRVQAAGGGEPAGAWKESELGDREPTGQSATGAAPSAGGVNDPIDDPQLAAQLGAEPEDDYFARVYREYVAAKQAAGENVSNIPQDKFTLRLKGNAGKLATQHGVRLVRFKVESAGGQVSLRPVLIR